MSLLVTFPFYLGFVASLVISYYGILLSISLKGSSLGNVTRFMTASVFFWGFHHLLKALVNEMTFWNMFSEIFEVLSGIALFIAILFIYKIAHEVYVPNASPQNHDKRKH